MKYILFADGEEFSGADTAENLRLEMDKAFRAGCLPSQMRVYAEINFTYTAPESKLALG